MPDPDDDERRPAWSAAAKKLLSASLSPDGTIPRGGSCANGAALFVKVYAGWGVVPGMASGSSAGPPPLPAAVDTARAGAGVAMLIVDGTVMAGGRQDVDIGPSMNGTGAAARNAN